MSFCITGPYLKDLTSPGFIPLNHFCGRTNVYAYGLFSCIHGNHPSDWGFRNGRDILQGEVSHLSTELFAEHIRASSVEYG
ncbi:hypothetical protein BELL_0313g00010 [Botrytis elliptica]|uniref:Uncharacterized protein n=1 Tax=Botrytis elliptica TaxID=278938 RepID=A0A4Z1JK06_9HELO|nr:hypothetical protein BELL_0313g00010 [Botrytis elliptica]